MNNNYRGAEMQRFHRIIIEKPIDPITDFHAPASPSIHDKISTQYEIHYDHSMPSAKAKIENLIRKFNTEDRTPKTLLIGIGWLKQLLHEMHDLRRCINSGSKFTYHDLDIVLVDDEWHLDICGSVQDELFRILEGR